MDSPQIQNQKLIDKKLEIIPCNLCNSSSYGVVYSAQYGLEKDFDLVKKFRASGDELLIDQLVKCKRCGLIYVSPRLRGSAIVEAYSEGEDPLFVSQATAREKTFFQALEKIEKYYPKKGKILDVGTAGGSFLAAAKKRKWDVYGCEPNKWLASWGKKHYEIDIRPGTIFDQKYMKNYFDVVTLWDVIEHTPDPSKVLKECNRVLKSGGLLVVNYPDIGSWIAKITGRKWLFLTSVHLYYFTRKTMEKMLNKSGFRVKIIRPHFQKLELDYLLMRGSTYSKIISQFGRMIAKTIGLQQVNVPYWLGQTFVLAEKK